MYGSVCAYSDYIDKWFHRKAGVLKFSDYLRLVEIVRRNQYPIRIKFGLEVCYFKEFEELVGDIVKDKDLDFILGSVHFIDDFAFDHKAEHWVDVNVDKVFQRYFEISLDLVHCGIYTGIAHPDCIKLFGHTPSFLLHEYYEKMAQGLSYKKMYAEQSSGIFRRCPNTAELGMNKNMLRHMKKYDVNIVTASDAHCPEDVGAYIQEQNDLIEQA